MAYQQLSTTTPVVERDRITNLETEMQANESPGLLGTHVYCTGGLPGLTTTGTDTAGVAGQLFVGELRIHQNTLITGLSFLIGSVGGTDKAIVQFFDVNGVVLATSALAGTTVGTAATMQRIAFITAYKAAPGLYYVGVQYNGTTAKIRTQVFGDHNVGTVAQTFGTPATITPPTSFTTAQGPLVMTY